MNIETVELEIATLSPALVSSGPQAHNLMETLDFIPGNSIRGIFANRYLETKGKSAADPAFERLFLTGETIFDFATLDGSEPIPLSARSCKYDTGFEADGNHGVLDLLLAGEGEKTCPVCGRAIDYMEGFWNPICKMERRVEKRLIARTAIDPERGVASEGKLYSQRCIEEGMVFKSEIHVPEDLLDVLESLLSEPFTAGIGKGRSRGQGWMQIEKAERQIPRPPSTDAATRFLMFKAHARKGMLAVTLLSDAVFQDKYLRDKTAPDVFDLAPLDIDPGDWNPKPVKAFASARMVFGFDGPPLLLPRIPRLAVTAGSVFMFEPKNGVVPKIPAGNGMGRIGEINGEGFGKAVLWHPFHCEFKAEKPEQVIIENAKRFYFFGFDWKKMSASQISAVGDRFRNQASLEQAKESAIKFISGQLEKLGKKREEGKTASWLTNAKDEQGNLGEILIDWIKNEKYLGKTKFEHTDRLKALRQFWNFVEDQYNFEKSLPKDMRIKKEE